MVKKKITKKKEIKHSTKRKSHSKKQKSDYDIAYDFSTKAYKKFQEAIKSIVLFGSVSKHDTTKGSDIDILVIVDDCSVQWDQELIAWYREEMGKLLESQSDKLHINTVTLSTFWEDVREGEPAAINIIRYGQTLIDFGGFFDPLKALLAKGRIRATSEAVFTTLRRAPMHISTAKFDIVNSIEHLYWAMVDSAHSALMAKNQIPPSPEHVGEMLEEIFVKNKILDKKYVKWYEEMYQLAHDIIHGNVKHLTGKDIDVLMARTIDFEKKLRDITSNLIHKRKIIREELKE